MSRVRPHRAAEPALLSLLAWPEKWSVEQRVEALASKVGLEPSGGAALARRATPLAVDFFPEESARVMARDLRAIGVPALVLEGAALNATSEQRVLAKRLAPALGAPEPMYLVEPWDRRVQPVPLRMTEVRFIIRGQIEVAERASAPEKVDPRMGNPIGRVLQDELLMGELDPEAPGTLAPGPRRPRTTGEIIDLYCDGLVPIRIDGRKFNYDLLGPERGLTDRVNADRLAIRLTREAPRAELDLGWSDWKPPRRAAGQGESRAGARDSSPLFDLYSAWRWLVMVALERARAARNQRPGPESDSAASQ